MTDLISRLHAYIAQREKIRDGGDTVTECNGEPLTLTDLREAAAEIERLRAEADRWKTNYNAAIELKGRAFAESDRLAEALRWYVENDDTNEGQEGNEYWLAGRDRAIAVLRDHDKEGEDG